MRARQRFNVKAGDVKAVIRFEIGDVVMGDGGIDYGADEKIIEVKRAYLDIPVYGPARFKGGAIGYASPGSLVFDGDGGGASFYAEAGDIELDLTWLKENEGETGSGGDDRDLLTFQAAFPAGAGSVNPGVSLDYSGGFGSYTIFPAVSASYPVGPVDLDIAAAGAFGTSPSDADITGFAGSLFVSYDMGGKVTPKAFVVFISGDDDLGDNKVKSYSAVAPYEFWSATNYFYSNGIKGFGFGESSHDSFGALSFGGGFATEVGNLSAHLIGAYHMAAADPGIDKGYGFEVNLNGAYKLADAAKLKYEFDLFAPGDFYGDADPEWALIVGPEIKW
jgi:hypothetical protein